MGPARQPLREKQAEDVVSSVVQFHLLPIAFFVRTASTYSFSVPALMLLIGSS
jgi:hypothetical protein